MSGDMATIGVFAIILDDTRRMLCVRLNYAHRGWTTPGGRVEAGESPRLALKREVLEETGYRVEVGPLIGVYFKVYENDVVFSFEAQVTDRVAWTSNEEIAEVQFFSKAELPHKMTAVVRKRIEDGFEGVRGVFREFTDPRDSIAI
jgi:8-oxo-dGTP pyrophosphatase MutT (NUDIX family)